MLNIARDHLTIKSWQADSLVYVRIESDTGYYLGIDGKKNGDTCTYIVTTSKGQGITDGRAVIMGILYREVSFAVSHGDAVGIVGLDNVKGFPIKVKNADHCILDVTKGKSTHNNGKIVLTPESGWEFSEGAYLRAQRTSGDMSWHKFASVSADGSITSEFDNNTLVGVENGTRHFLGLGTIELVGSVVEIPKAGVVNNVPNSKATWSDADTQLVITADDGYIFDGDIKVQYTDSTFGDTQSKVIAHDGETSGSTFLEADTTRPITLSGKTKAKDTPAPTPEPSWTYTNNVSGVSDSITAAHVLTITTAQGRVLDGVLTATCAGVSVEFGQDGATTATINLETAFPDGGEVVVSGKTKVKAEPKPDKTYLMEYDMTAATITPNADRYNSTDTITFTATAGQGAAFKTAPTLAYTDGLGDTTSVRFTLSDGGKTATLTFHFSTIAGKSVDSITITAAATPEVIPEKSRGSINLYEVTDEQLGQFADTRFYTQGSGQQVEVVDLGKFVVRLHRLFVTATTLTPTTINAGGYATEVGAMTLADDAVVVDFGEVTIKPHDGCSTDFNGELQVYLPFMGAQSVDIHDLGKTLHLTLAVDAVSGDGLYSMEVDGVPIYQWQCKASSDVLYRSGDDFQASTIGGSQWNGNALWGLKPYIVHTLHDGMSSKRNSTNRRTRIGDAVGYGRFDNVTFADGCMVRPQHMERLLSLLRDGVTI